MPYLECSRWQNPPTCLNLGSNLRQHAWIMLWITGNSTLPFEGLTFECQHQAFSTRSGTYAEQHSGKHLNESVQAQVSDTIVMDRSSALRSCVLRSEWLPGRCWRRVPLAGSRLARGPLAGPHDGLLRAGYKLPVRQIRLRGPAPVQVRNRPAPTRSTVDA